MTTIPRASAAVLLAASLWAAPPAADAQDRAVRDLSNRVERLQRELSALQRRVFQGGQAPAGAAVSPDDARAARSEVRLNVMEKELRRLTGEIEVLGHRVGGVASRLDALAGDVGRRLDALERAAPPRPAAAPPSPGSGGVLGAVPGSEAAAAPSGSAPAGGSALPEGSPKTQYEFARNLMQKQDFPAAEAAWTAFLARRPDHPLSGRARHWLGEARFARGNYRDAAIAFGESYQKRPRGEKAPDSLLKLGMSLARLDRRKEACIAFSRALADFPKASDRLKRRVRRERARHKCG